jgi:nitrate/nitrite-specific signal transduction histidine kinase
MIKFSLKMEFKKKYVYSALFLALLIIINQIIVQYLLFQKRQDANVINIAGRQRMLSQKVNLMVYKVYENNNYDTKNELMLVFKEWKKSHIQVVELNDKTIIYKNNRERIKEKLKENLKRIEEVEKLLLQEKNINKVQLYKISDIISLFLVNMEIIISDLEELSNKKLYSVIVVELFIASVSLFLIYFEFKKIILPISEKISQDLAVMQSQFEELKKQEIKILEQNETLKQIAWQQSHELRRPVANILGLCNLLKNYQNETEEMKSKYIDYMLQATNELDEIIHKIVLQANEIGYKK